MLYNVCLNQFFDIFFDNLSTLGKSCDFFSKYLKPHAHALSEMGLFSLFFCFFLLFFYYILKMNWANFWKLLMSSGNFQTWLISVSSSTPKNLLQGKSQRNKNVRHLVLYNFCFDIFFVSALLKRLLPKN